MGQNLQSQDWPYLSRYKEENLRLQNEPKTTNRVVFIGDSITEFWSKEQADFFSNKNYVNRGISGQTSPQILLRFRADVVLLQPKVVIILAGGNDIAGNTGESSLEMILNNIQSMIEIAKANHLSIVLCSLLPANFFYWMPKKQPAKTIIAFNQLLRECANRNNLPFVDYYTALVDDNLGLPPKFSEDGVHPNANGYRIMQPLIEEVVNKLITIA
ncbi:SGNH/GDSL hydrolase family protein [Flavobacterium sp. 7A]|uniref:SGNH/GDSL hydrolase family protein n=1 Tax=Flavobacterium sp. 7A TaxID=2940571 RepID=UPI00222618B3|nr:SGNH/GDSL hydrolase family protein [Flavobacterium sp. 7A]MCW2119578.1 lysophospholipase L1-like esterase [Flavobacterium sp. 7A]